ncbi:tyrosine-type recombinase/integrase [Vibrio hangzhouensis]|uniref:tyrosine-type recombinase/integrase n=1 Tax=Vibrio hangzhouensis TaxID=462991 RepID=UPI001C964E96|nr:tyrosine-type recombinase/integrase [Vibrio hangzhouensis]MBY6198698.1 tyrosine-type recombinase/integrase [Vibrio hangzhouensis]
MKFDKLETKQVPQKTPQKRQLKARTRKKRKGTRVSNISLDVDDYKQSSVARAVCHELNMKEPILAESTFTAMKSHARHIIKQFGAKYLNELSVEDIEIFRTTLLQRGCKGKVVNGCYTLLRAVCAKALVSGHQNCNLMDTFQNLKVVNKEPNPLNEHEIKQLLLTDTDNKSAKYMTLFGVLTALRISELICVSWENVEFFEENGVEKCRLYIDLAKPLNRYKVTKTEESMRVIELSSEAAQVLRDLEPLTAKKAPISIDIVERDNITVRKDKRKFIFLNEQTGQPWINSKQFAKQFFTDFLKKARVPHRGPSQLRHSCASLHYNGGTSVVWIASLLGHRDVSIVEQHYAKRNKVSLKKEQKKAENTISDLFKLSDENTIKVPREIVQAKTRSVNAIDKEFIKSMLNLAQSTENEEHREQIIQVISQTLNKE